MAGVSSDVRPVSPLRPIVEFLGIWQRWSFFAASPTRVQEWPVVSIEWSDGTASNPLLEWTPVRFERPDDPPATYGNIRWAMYFGTISRPQGKGRRDDAVRYFCRRANEYSRGTGVAPLKASLYWVEGTTPAYADEQTFKIILLSTQDCRTLLR